MTDTQTTGTITIVNSKERVAYTVGCSPEAVVINDEGHMLLNLCYPLDEPGRIRITNIEITPRVVQAIVEAAGVKVGS